MQRPLADEPGCGGIPEGGRPAVAQGDLVAVGQAEELTEPLTNPRDKVLDRRLAVRGPHQLVLTRQPGEGLGPHLRGAAAEAAVGRLQRVGDLNKCSCHRFNVLGGKARVPSGAWGRVAARPKGPAAPGACGIPTTSTWRNLCTRSAMRPIPPWRAGTG